MENNFTQKEVDERIDKTTDKVRNNKNSIFKIEFRCNKKNFTNSSTSKIMI